MKRPSWGVSFTLFLILLVGCTSVDREEAARAYFNLGNAYFELGELQESKRAYERALELEPSLTAATYNLARLYIEEERYDEAEEILLDLVAEDPGNIILHETLGWLAYRRDRPEEAAARYREAVAISPANASAWYNLGRIYQLLEQYEQAREAYENGIYYEPEVLRYRLALAQFHADRKEYATAADLLYPVFADGEREEDLILALTEHLIDAEDYPGALEVADAGIDQFEGRPQSESGETLAELYFLKSFTLLVGFEDTAAGLELLNQALEEGYADRERAADLYGRTELPGAEDVRRLLDQHNLAPQPESSGEPEV